MKIDSANLAHSASECHSSVVHNRSSQPKLEFHPRDRTAPSLRGVDDPFGSKHGLTILTHKSYATAPSHEDEWPKTKKPRWLTLWLNCLLFLAQFMKKGRCILNSRVILCKMRQCDVMTIQKYDGTTVRRHDDTEIRLYDDATMRRYDDTTHRLELLE